MTIIIIALIVICFLFALTAIAVCRKLTPVVKDKRNVHHVFISASDADDYYNTYKRFIVMDKSIDVEQGDIIKFVPVDDNRYMSKHVIVKRHFQVVDIVDGSEYNRDDLVFLSIAPCYYSFKD